MKKLVAVSLAMSMVAGMLVSGAAVSADEKEHYTIGCIIISDTNPHCLTFADTFEKLVKERGDEPVVLAANYDPELLVQEFSDLMELGVDGIVLESPDAEAPVNAIKECVAKGIPVAASDVLISIDESEGVLVSQTVSDNYGGGVLCGEDFLKRIGEDEEATVCHIVLEQNAAVTERVKGFIDTVTQNPNVTVLEGQQPIPESQEEEMKIAEAWAQKYDNITGVFGGGDPIALAFVSGLKAAGMEVGSENGTYVYGVDGSQDAFASIKDGVLTGTAKQQPDELCRIPLEDIYTVLEGGTIDHDWLTYVPVVYVDATNVDDYIE